MPISAMVSVASRGLPSLGLGPDGVVASVVGVGVALGDGGVGVALGDGDAVGRADDDGTSEFPVSGGVVDGEAAAGAELTSPREASDVSSAQLATTTRISPAASTLDRMHQRYVRPWPPG
ncbi:hypothetical protein [Phytoactinopolyspora endophytica]|uniref:hypothetical protein n=1 Tax=Phytoactinopolyspora endophytica TaxID=1642495 RepID=UPI00197BC16C|nr:hypothetical protein [Phytoactinopolyspora endophytica]